MSCSKSRKARHCIYITSWGNTKTHQTITYTGQFPQSNCSLKITIQKLALLPSSDEVQCMPRQRLMHSSSPNRVGFISYLMTEAKPNSKTPWFLAKEETTKHTFQFTDIHHKPLDKSRCIIIPVQAVQNPRKE